MKVGLQKELNDVKETLKTFVSILPNIRMYLDHNYLDEYIQRSVYRILDDVLNHPDNMMLKTLESGRVNIYQCQGFLEGLIRIAIRDLRIFQHLYLNDRSMNMILELCSDQLREYIIHNNLWARRCV